ncbi:hypothetical protein [Nocardia flavorosea]|uniref:Uncharacterized protein n=1 Tax=Nocardia flavorosea TaxID=53429 RepID=A0A846YN89_9NOCA|nr:hypothetical protein [Nocardia flavorosea]NKY60525.1 hypothetical protein [Nocardia flavorosea]
MADDPYADLPPEYLQILREKEAEQSTEPTESVIRSDPRGPTQEEEEEMDRYYGRASWLETDRPRSTVEPREEWYPPAIGDGI